MATILLIEDNESMAKMLNQALTSEGYKVLLARDKPAGIENMQEESIDLVLSDLRLPSGTGIEVLHATREHNPFIPVIIMTAFASIESAVEAMIKGAVDYIVKPFLNEEIKLTIKKILEQKKLLRENIALKQQVSQ